MNFLVGNVTTTIIFSLKTYLDDRGVGDPEDRVDRGKKTSGGLTKSLLKEVKETKNQPYQRRRDVTR